MTRHRWWSRWKPKAVATRIERELSTDIDYGPIGSIPDGLLSEHSDREENRALGPALWAAAARGRAEDWGRCIPAFQDAHLRDPDWDIPYIWFATFLESQGKVQSAIRLLRNAVTYCRRKSVLLRKAGELCLFNGEPRLALHLFAQAVAAKPDAPGLEDNGSLYLCCQLEVVFEELGDPEGAAWASSLNNYTHINDAAKNRIRVAIAKANFAERSLLLEETPVISTALRQLM